MTKMLTGERRTRRRVLLSGIAGLWLVATLMVLGLPRRAEPAVEVGPPAAPALPENAVVVTHWAVAELMAPELLPQAAEINKAGYHTSSGRPIVAQPVLVSSSRQVELLGARVSRGAMLDPKVPDPIVVTPKIDHWLDQLNALAGRTIVDPYSAPSLAVSWLGIATYRGMAECLGWPNKEIGLADIVALRANPLGWSSCPTAKAEWGVQPLLSFTDPGSSSTARSALFSLYAIAAAKPTDQLTEADVSRADVVEYVKAFQQNVDHYVPDTLTLQTKMFQGPRYGHFYIVEENTLVQLYQGKLPVTIGADSAPQPLTRDMVFVYPREGSLAHNHPAGLVQAPWVGAEETEAAQRWIAFLREDVQQQTFMSAGFRPATQLPLADPISARFGLDPAGPSHVLPPVNPPAVSAMLRDWGEVKKPGAVTFVLDASPSMHGAKLDQAKQGLIRALDAVANRNEVGLLAFGSNITARVPVGPIATNRFTLADAINKVGVSGGTALYDAIAEAVTMTDGAAVDGDTIRGVVVLTDGQANAGRLHLDDVVRMTSRSEKPIVHFVGFDDRQAIEAGGARVEKSDVIGAGLVLGTRHPVHIFFIGIGADADLQIGRILAEATNSTYQGVTAQDLANVIEQFGKYF